MMYNYCTMCVFLYVCVCLYVCVSVYFYICRYASFQKAKEKNTNNNNKKKETLSSQQQQCTRRRGAIALYCSRQIYILCHCFSFTVNGLRTVINRKEEILTSSPVDARGSHFYSFFVQNYIWYVPIYGTPPLLPFIFYIRIQIVIIPYKYYFCLLEQGNDGSQLCC